AMPSDFQAKTSTGQIRRFEDLKKRHDNLRAEKSRVEGQAEVQEKNLESLRRQAEEQFGTSDLAELEAKLDAMRAENERKLAEYADSLEGSERSLEALDSAAADGPEADTQP